MITEPIIGIYKFTNKINGLSYIGQSIDIEARRKRHIRIIRMSVLPKQENSYFHRALKKYGQANFIFEVIEVFSKDNLKENKQILNNAEKKWVDFFNTVSPNGYNSKSGGGQDIKYSLTARQRMSQVQKIIQTQKSTRPSIPVTCVETGITYSSSKEAAKVYGIRHLCTIRECCRRKQRTSGGFHWCYPKDYTPDLLAILKNQEAKNQEKPANSVICIETGEIFRSPRQAEKAVANGNNLHILDCCRGLRPTAGGYHWQFTEKQL